VIGSEPLVPSPDAKNSNASYYTPSAPEYVENKHPEEDTFVVYTQYVAEMDGKAKSSLLSMLFLMLNSFFDKGVQYCLAAAFLDNYSYMH
jgi:hypothetical protein